MLSPRCHPLYIMQSYEHISGLRAPAPAPMQASSQIINMPKYPNMRRMIVVNIRVVMFNGACLIKAMVWFPGNIQSVMERAHYFYRYETRQEDY